MAINGGGSGNAENGVPELTPDTGVGYGVSEDRLLGQHPMTQNEIMDMLESKTDPSK